MVEIKIVGFITKDEEEVEQIEEIAKVFVYEERIIFMAAEARKQEEARREKIFRQEEAHKEIDELLINIENQKFRDTDVEKISGSDRSFFRKFLDFGKAIIRPE